jgi:hypothetical protein
VASYLHIYSLLLSMQSRLSLSRHPFLTRGSKTASVPRPFIPNIFVPKLRLGRDIFFSNRMRLQESVPVFLQKPASLNLPELYRGVGTSQRRDFHPPSQALEVWGEVLHSNSILSCGRLSSQ